MPVYKSLLQGQDTLSQIGLPPSELSKETLGRQKVVGYEKWASDFQKYFPVAKKGSEDISFKAVDVQSYPEPEIDALRAQKDEELENIRASNLRRLKDRDNYDALGVPGLPKDRKKKDKSYSRAKAAQMGTA